MRLRLGRWILSLLCLVGALGRVGLSKADDAIKQLPAVDHYGDPLPAGAIARLGTVRFRHVGPVRSVAYSPDGKSLASADHNGEVRLWDASTGKELRRLDRQSYGTHSLTFTPDNKALAGVTLDGAIRIWEAATGKELRQLPGTKDLYLPINAIAISPDGSTLAAGKEHTVCLWDLATAKELRQLYGHQSLIVSVAFSPDGKTLASAGSHDKTIRLWNPATGQELLKLQGGAPIIFSPDGKLLAGLSAPNGLNVWDAATGKLVQKPTKDKLRGNCALAFSPDGRILAWSDWKDNVIHVHDMTLDKEIRRFGGGASGAYGLAFSPDGKVLASGGHDRLLRRWDAISGEEINPWPGHRWMVFSVAFTPDRKTLVTASGESVWLWNTQGYRESRRLLPGASPIAVSPDGKFLATGSGQRDDESIRLWDLASGELLRRFSGHQNLVRSLAFSPDGRSLVSGSFDQTVSHWDITTGKLRRQFQGHQGAVNSVTYSPDGKTVASASFDKTVRVWNTESGKQIAVFDHPHNVEAIAFSPDGRILATGGNSRTIRFWDMASGKVVGQPWQSPTSNVRSLTISPDGRSLAAASYDGTILVWERISARLTHQFHTPEFAVNTVAFAHDGRTLATGGADSTSLIFDLTGRLADGKLPTIPLHDATLETLWADLASSDAKKAMEAFWFLVQAPGQTEPFLQKRIHPSPATDPKLVQRLLADLDSIEFTVRNRATEELKKLGDTAIDALRAALAGRPNLEAQRRLEKLLELAENPAYSPVRLRELRAVGVLEQLNTTVSRHCLDTLAQGASEATLTREAQAARQRLASYRVH